MQSLCVITKYDIQIFMVLNNAKSINFYIPNRTSVSRPLNIKLKKTKLIPAIPETENINASILHCKKRLGQNSTLTK